MDRLGLIQGILRAMTRNDWELSQSPQGEGWRLARNTEALYVDCNHHWLNLSMSVVAVSASNSPLYDYLLLLCRRCFMAKYSLDSGGQILLQAEIPLVSLERKFCQQAFEAIAVYSQKYSTLLSTMASNPERIGSTTTAIPSVSDSRKEMEVFSQQNMVLYVSTVEHQGWHLKDRPALNQWQIVYKGYDHSLDGFLCFDRSWAYFQMLLLHEAYVPQQHSALCHANFYSYLLRLNEEIYWAKLGLDEDGQVLLLLEIPLVMFDLQRFRWAMHTLATYINDYVGDIQIMAKLEQDKRLASLFSGKGKEEKMR